MIDELLRWSEISLRPGLESISNSMATSVSLDLLYTTLAASAVLSESRAVIDLCYVLEGKSHVVWILAHPCDPRTRPTME